MIGIVQRGYTLKLKNFEGPLDLLLELIGDQKLNVAEITLSDLTDQYLHYIKTMQLFNIDIASEFFVMAATLVYLKTKRLLPNPRKEEEEFVDEKELIERLREYKKYQQIGRFLEEMMQEGGIYYSRGYVRNPTGADEKLEVEEYLLGDLINVLKRYKGAFIRKAIPIKRREVNVEKKMNFILSLLSAKKMVKFSEVTEEENTKVDKIASFLGAVELSFRQKVLLKQLQLFTDIDIERRDEILV